MFWQKSGNTTAKRAAVRVMQKHNEAVDIKRPTFYYESKMMQKNQPMMEKIKSLSKAYQGFVTEKLPY